MSNLVLETIPLEENTELRIVEGRKGTFNVVYWDNDANASYGACLGFGTIERARQYAKNTASNENVGWVTV